MQNTLLKEYVKLEEKFKALETEKKELRTKIVEDMTKAKMEKIETDFGSFTICQKASWKYTEAVEKIEDRLKIARIKEQEKGLAKRSVTEYLLFTAPKEI